MGAGRTPRAVQTHDNETPGTRTRVLSKAPRLCIQRSSPRAAGRLVLDDHARGRLALRKGKVRILEYFHCIPLSESGLNVGHGSIGS